MSNILEMLSANLSKERVQAISDRIGASPEQTQSAIETALLTLLGALERQRRKPRSSGILNLATS